MNLRMRQICLVARELAPTVEDLPRGLRSRRLLPRQEAQEHLTLATTMYREMDMLFSLERAEADPDT